MEDSRDSEYEQGPPPAVLTHAVRVWWIAAVAAAACGGYIALNLATVRGALRDRLEQGVSAQEAKAAASGFSSLATAAPIVALVLLVGLYTAQLPLLLAIRSQRSRRARSAFAALALMAVLVIPAITDMVLRGGGWVIAAAYVQVPVLLVAVALVMPRSVGRWLPPPVRSLGRVRSRPIDPDEN